MPEGSSTPKKRTRLWFLVGAAVVMCLCMSTAVGLLNSDDEETRTTSPTAVRTGRAATATVNAQASRTPAPSATSTSTAIPTVDTSECRLGSAYVADVTIPDNTSVEIGSSFVKTWRIRNTGACVWGSGYTLVFIAGDAMSEGMPVSIPDTQAGAEIEVSVPMTAPNEPGRYRGEWQVCVNDTECFGQKISVQIIAVPPPTATPRPTSPPTATPLPSTAGATDWLTYEGQRVGVKEIAWNTSLGYFRPDADHIYLSLYIITINVGQETETFDPDDVSVIDGGGEVTGGVIFGEKEPTFDVCTVRPGGMCEGWWTTMIWDRPEVRSDLTFHWSPGWFVPSQETEIIQD